MTTTRAFPHPATPGAAAPGPGRHLAALALHGASVALSRLALRLLHVRRPAARPEPVLEFHDGHLYLDGQLAGTLPGVRRL